ncbi:hypothetical protein EVAR_71835_1 [Eumeta japonica]|uniref:Uncharacterized protein n=1 Tax=Eumeta variegata TaxID=151549 RepID=A0A4C1T2N9_EUMVA|nr:hypothetical protein EVAR_71835_1 [Eumeta japonica]
MYVNTEVHKDLMQNPSGVTLKPCFTKQEEFWKQESQISFHTEATHVHIPAVEVIEQQENISANSSNSIFEQLSSLSAASPEQVMDSISITDANAPAYIEDNSTTSRQPKRTFENKATSPLAPGMFIDTILLLRLVNTKPRYISTKPKTEQNESEE